MFDDVEKKLQEPEDVFSPRSSAESRPRQRHGRASRGAEVSLCQDHFFWGASTIHSLKYWKLNWISKYFYDCVLDKKKKQNKKQLPPFYRNQFWVWHVGYCLQQDAVQCCLNAKSSKHCNSRFFFDK